MTKDLDQMDVLSLPCAPVWGAPIDGSLFSSEAFNLYSVSRTEERALSAAQPSLTPISDQQARGTSSMSCDAELLRLDALHAMDLGSCGESGSIATASEATSPCGKSHEGKDNAQLPLKNGPDATPDIADVQHQRPHIHSSLQGTGMQANAPAKAIPASSPSIFQPERRRTPHGPNILPSRPSAAPLRQVDVLPPPKRRAGRPRGQTSRAPAAHQKRGDPVQKQGAGPAAKPRQHRVQESLRDSFAQPTVHSGTDAMANPTLPNTVSSTKSGRHEHAAAKAATTKAKHGGNAKSKMRWSGLVDSEHAWFLDHLGKELDGDDAATFETLAALVASERAAVIEWQAKDAAANPGRYNFVAKRALQQMEADIRHRQTRAFRYPRLYYLKGTFQCPGIARTGEGGDEEASLEMRHLQQMHRRTPSLQLLPPNPFRFPLNVPYLPSGGYRVVGPMPQRGLAISADCAQREQLGSSTQQQPGRDEPCGANIIAAAGSIDKAADANVDTEAAHLSTKAQSNSGEEQPERLQTVKKEGAVDVSCDPLAAELVQRASAHGMSSSAPCIAMAASAFKTIMSTLPQDLGLGWEIPVRIGRDCGSQEQLAIFIDKPLMPRVMTLRSKHERLYKHALVSLAARAARLATPSTTPKQPVHSSTPDDVVAKPDAAVQQSAQPGNNPPCDGAAAGGSVTGKQESQDTSRIVGNSGSKPEPSTMAASASDAQAEQRQTKQDSTPVCVTRAAAARAASAVTEGDPKPSAHGGASHCAESDEPATASQDSLSQQVEKPADSAAAARPPRRNDDIQPLRIDDGLAAMQATGAKGAPSVPASRSSTAASDVASDAPQRGFSYDLWQLDRFRLVIRAHEAAVLMQPAEPSTPGQATDRAASRAGSHSHTTLLPRAKMEYLSHKGSEMVTAEECARWWAATKIRPDAALLLGRVAVDTSELQSSRVVTAGEVRSMCDERGWTPTWGYHLLAAVLAELEGKAEGQYLLTHSPGADHVCCFEAMPPSEQGDQCAPPLPCSAAALSGGDAGAQRGMLYDLHSAHASAGATADGAAAFVPLEWRPFNPHIPQIPGTFPVRVYGAPKPGAAAAEAERERRRQRRLMPSAWAALGVGGDWDSTTAAGNSGTTGSLPKTSFSKTDYLQALAEEELI